MLYFRLTNRDGSLLIEDFSPRQATQINGFQVPAGSTVELSPGDYLGFLAYVLVVEVVPPGVAPEGSPA